MKHDTRDTDDDAGMDRRSYLQATGAAALGSAALAGCLGTARGTLATHVTDQPGDIEDFESLVVTVEGFWLGPEGADSGADEQGVDGNADGQDADDGTTDDGGGDDGSEDDGSEDDGSEDDDGDPSGREYHEFDEPQEADLVQLQGDNVQLIDERELDVASYRFLQLDVADGIDATLTDGDAAEVVTPGEAPLTFNAEFEIREDTRTSFTADFTPVRRGQTGTYVLQPVPSGIEVSYGTDDE